jgi:hypothetical protein
MSRINFFKIKQGKKATLAEWCERLNTTLRTEAIETLKEEGIKREIFRLYEIDGQDYLMTYEEADGEPTGANILKEINKQHRAILDECIEKRMPGKNLYDILQG